MSAIAGIYRRDHADVDRAHLDRMTAALRHRGTDTPITWLRGPVGLIQGLRPITPPPRPENGTLTYQDGAYALSADARLDNRRDLLRSLNFSGRSFAEIADGDFLVAAYQRWGERCVDHLIGDFSFALWDARKHTLFCARDHLGIRPFYYAQVGQCFCFASEIKGLLTLPGFAPRINEAKLLDFLLQEYHDKAATFYQDIFRLPPAHTLTISPEGVRISRYWALDSNRELAPASDADYTEQFLDLFTEAVRCRLSTNGAIGTMLSGGLDSSAVTGTARALLAQTSTRPLDTFSAVYPSQPQVDERDYVARVVDQGDITPHFLRADEFGPLGDGAQVFQAIEEPHPFPHLSMVSGLLRIAREQHIDVVLDGVDGDAAISHGLGILLELGYQGRWSEFAALTTALGQHYGAYGDVSRHLQKSYGFTALTHLIRDGHWIAAATAVVQINRRFGIPRAAILQSALRAPLILRPLRQLKHRRKAWADISALLSPDFAHRIDFAQHDAALRQSQPNSIRTDRQQQVDTLNSCWLTEALDALDKTSAVYGVELRHPFFDKRLVEFCVALPVTQKIDAGWTRLILRRAMQDVLPPEIQWREGKSNLEPNFLKSFLKYNRPQIEQALIYEPDVLEPYLNIAKIRAIYDDLLAHPTTTTAERVWSATQLWYWLNQQ